MSFDKSFDKQLREAEEFIDWCQEEDLRLRELAKDDPELAAILADADAQYEAKYGKSWINPKA